MRKALSFCAKALKFAVPLGTGIALLAIWISTERTSGRFYFQDFVVLVVLLIIIFLADSLEVSYSLLRYKDIEQFSGNARRVLEELHQNEGLVYEAREWLVTFLIVLITLRGEFDNISAPFYGKPLPSLSIPGIVDIPARTIFSLLFTTLPVLWFAQGPSKRIARASSLKVFEASVAIWGLIKKVGWLVNLLGLDGPADITSNLLIKSDRFRDEQNLKPSDFAFYVASVQRYGYSLHDLANHVIINPDGSSTIKQRILYYIIARPCNVFVRKLKTDAPSTGFKVLKIAAYQVPRIQDSDPAGKQSPVVKSLNALLGDEQGPDLAWKLLPANLSVSEEVDHENRSHYRIDTRGSIATDSGAFAIAAEFESSWAPGSFKVGIGERDRYLTSFDCPTYRYRLTIECAQDCNFRISELATDALCGEDPHWGERDRFQDSLGYESLSPRGLYCDIAYPFPGTRYILGWKNTHPLGLAQLPNLERNSTPEPRGGALTA